MNRLFPVLFLACALAGICSLSPMDNNPTPLNSAQRLQQVGDVDVLSEKQIIYIFKETLENNPRVLITIMRYGKSVIKDDPQDTVERSIDAIIDVAEKYKQSHPEPRRSISEDGEELTHECIWQMGQK